MVLEAQTLHYFLKKFKFFFLILILLLLFLLSIYSYYILNKNFNTEDDIITIKKGDTVSSVIETVNLETNNLDELIYKFYYLFFNILNNKFIHYGDFFIGKKVSFFQLMDIITKPSNVLNKITIVEGWTQYDLQNELSKHFESFSEVDYTEILADTYYFQKNETFEQFISKLKKFKKNYITQFENSIFFQTYNTNELLIIGSLIEKEGLDYQDKKNISSVIMNRLNKNMKLQIDATVLYALTSGSFNLNRKITFNDLKIDNPFNTYKIDGLPPKPICFVGSKTLNIIMEDYKTEYLFYFYNEKLQKHIFTKNFKDHKEKLNEYRKNK